MLRPYVCVACEKVIIAADGVASLIGLFSKIIIPVPAETEIPRNAVAPKEWAVFSVWDIDQGDELKKYTLCTQILYPDQSQFAEVVKTKMKTELSKRSQMNIQILGFPIGQIGQYTIRTWVEENQQRIFGPIEFKIELEMTKQEQPQKAI
jgi:hypothetical protein